MSEKTITIKPSIFVQRKLGNFESLCKEYDILDKKLGEGFFGSVEVVQLKGTKQNRAMKKIDKKVLMDKGHEDEFIKEIDILKTLDHPNILKVYEFYEDDRYLYIITELCNGKELFDVISEKDETFSEQETMKIMQQCLSALQYAHAKFLTHRDIKPENIMIDPETLKLKIIDWGTCTSFKDAKIQQLAGSHYYIAPEILKKRGYDEKCDIWSLGIVFYFLIAGGCPFNSEKTLDLFEEIKCYKISVEGEEWDKISKECQDLLTQMLNPRPSRRISAQDALQHPWFSTQPSKVHQKFLKSKLNSLKSFQYQSKLQMATIQYVASHLMSQQEKDELSELFVHLDTNKDGKLSKKEIFDGYKNLYGEKEAQSIVNNIFNEVDVDNNGTIDYNEFLACTMHKQKLMSQTTLKRAFDLFDVDGDQQITAKEIKSVLQNNADTFDTQVWDSVIGEVDKDGNGIIDFNEFQLMMDNLADQQSKSNKRSTCTTPFQMITRSKAKTIEPIAEEDEDESYDNKDDNANNKPSIFVNLVNDENECKTPKKGLKEQPKFSSEQKSTSKKEKLHRLEDDYEEGGDDLGNNVKKQIKKK